jgi:hypothetical protein
MAHKLKDIAVKTSTYTDRNSGLEKGRYENVGVMMQGDDGNQFIILNRTFNPAGVPVAPGKDTVILSLFDPKDNQTQVPQNAYPPQPAAQGGYPQNYAPQHGQYVQPNGQPMTPQQVQAQRQTQARQPNPMPQHTDQGPF